MILTKKEREFIEDWLKVVSGEMDKLEFYRKWVTRKNERSFLDDYEAVKRGEMTLEEFRRGRTVAKILTKVNKPCHVSRI